MTTFVKIFFDAFNFVGGFLSARQFAESRNTESAQENSRICVVMWDFFGFLAKIHHSKVSFCIIGHNLFERFPAKSRE